MKPYSPDDAAKVAPLDEQDARARSVLVPVPMGVLDNAAARLRAAATAWNELGDPREAASAWGAFEDLYDCKMPAAPSDRLCSECGKPASDGISDGGWWRHVGDCGDARAKAAAVEWTDEEREAVEDRLAAFTVKVEDDDWMAEGFLTDDAREWVVKRALAALAPFVAGRQSALWCDECGCNNGEGGPTCLCGACRCATEAELDRLRATVARVEARLAEYERMCDPAPHTSERAFVERLRKALRGES